MPVILFFDKIPLVLAEQEKYIILPNGRGATTNEKEAT